MRTSRTRWRRRNPLWYSSMPLVCPCKAVNEQHFGDLCSTRVWSLQASEASVYQCCRSIEGQSKGRKKEKSNLSVRCSSLLLGRLLCHWLHQESKSLQRIRNPRISNHQIFQLRKIRRWLWKRKNGEKSYGFFFPRPSVSLRFQQEAFVEFMKDPEEQLKKAKTPPPAADPIEFWKDSAPGYEYVQMLTSNTFDTIVGASRKALVMFYAPWCGHCKTAKPALASAAAKLATLSKVNSISLKVPRDWAVLLM